MATTTWVTKFGRFSEHCSNFLDEHMLQLTSSMQRLSSSVCPFCEASRFLTSVRSQWQSTRGAATLQKRRPSRMVLSGTVSRGPRPTSGDGKPVRKSRDPDFGMNVTKVPRSLLASRQGSQSELKRSTRTAVASRQVSQAELKRSTRGAPAKAKKEERSSEPMKALKMQQRLSEVSYGQRTRIKNELAERDTFDTFDLLPSIQESIVSQTFKGLTHISPTPIQRLAIPALLERGSGSRKKRKTSEQMQQFLLAAETGSGKTLAYVLPIIDGIKRAEAWEQTETERKAQQQAREVKALSGNRRNILPTPEMANSRGDAGRPKALILMPTAELVSQVASVIKSLSHTVKFRAVAISSAVTPTVIRSRLFAPGGVDIVVSTPHLFSSIAETNPDVLSQVQYLVVDEADSLLDRSFSPITSAIIDRATPSLKQLILCSATIPRSLDSYLKKRYPETWRLATPNLHAIPRRVQLSVVDIDKIPYQGNRNLACAQIVWEIGKEAVEHAADREKRIIVFVNERETADQVATFLRGKGIKAYSFSRDSNQRQNDELLAAFTAADRTISDPEELVFDVESTPRGKLENTRVLVTTDIASRGIDTTPVKHVILYDVPHTSIDFIHRLGRVGRMGRRGRGIVLVGKNDRKDIVSEVRDGMFKGAALI